MIQDRPRETDGAPMLEVRDLKTHFPVRRGLFGRTVGYVRAVDGVSFTLGAGKTLGLVGESGCGKTTTGRTILRLIPATAGEVRFEGRDVFALPAGEMRRLREDMQIIFQDPYGSLNPRMTVGGIVGEPLRVHNRARGRDLSDRVAALLRRVGLSPDCRNRYPHEFSGGQRQRICVARALAPEPRLIVCDEPTSALDVSVQAQVLNLMSDLKDRFGLTYLFISHDLTVVQHMADRIGVLYLGRLVEEAPRDTLFAAPKHPYTRMLFDAAPRMDGFGREADPPKGEIPDPINPPPGCAFHPRCPLAEARCKAERPEMRRLGETRVACHLAE